MSTTTVNIEIDAATLAATSCENDLKVLSANLIKKEVDRYIALIKDVFGKPWFETRSFCRLRLNDYLIFDELCLLGFSGEIVSVPEGQGFTMTLHPRPDAAEGGGGSPSLGWQFQQAYESAQVRGAAYFADLVLVRVDQALQHTRSDKWYVLHFHDRRLQDAEVFAVVKQALADRGYTIDPPSGGFGDTRIEPNPRCMADAMAAALVRAREKASMWREAREATPRGEAEVVMELEEGMKRVHVSEESGAGQQQQ